LIQKIQFFLAQQTAYLHGNKYLLHLVALSENEKYAEVKRPNQQSQSVVVLKPSESKTWPCNGFNEYPKWRMQDKPQEFQAKPSGDNRYSTRKDTKTQGDGVVPAALAGIPKPEDDKSLSQVSLICGKLMQVNNLNKPVTFDLDPTKLGRSSKDLDLQKAVKPELAEKALKGDAAALSEILNNVSTILFCSISSWLQSLLKQRSKSKQQPSKPHYLD